MSSIETILIAIAVLALSGFPALFLPRHSPTGQRITVALTLLGCGLGFGGVALCFAGSSDAALDLAWFLPFGRFAVEVDPLSAVFLALVFFIPALGVIYGLGYWKQEERQGEGQRLGFFYSLLAASMAMVAVARDAVLFLLAWEIMAMAAYFAATAETDNPAARRAGWIYLIATHVGTLCLFAMFALWQAATGSFALASGSAVPAKTAGWIFGLALVGFGLKAGLWPLHIWLPGAHANAPSHVSALMSGVMLKIGIYGIARMSSLLPAPETWWGAVLLGLGALSGIAGIAFAIGQRDIKRLLAYSSIENIGIVAMGLGLALLGRTYARWDWIALGLGGALLHAWNHGLFKSLLFLNAGTIIHETGTRDMEKLGGLAKRMPFSAALFALGAAAICALPPLNGFVGEWLLYLGLFRSLGPGGGPDLPAASAAAVALALIGALAIACFVKILGAVYLGSARSPAGEKAHDPPPSMLLPMVALALACGFIGIVPSLALGAIDKAVSSWAGGEIAIPSIGEFAPIEWISRAALLLLVLAGLVFIAVLVRRRKGTAERAALAARAGSAAADVAPTVGTWDCGYAAPSARMQYGAASFAQNLVRQLSFFLWSKKRRSPIEGAFPAKARFRSSLPDLVLDRLIRPFFGLGRRLAPRIRILQQGQTQLYLVYVLVITAILLALGVQRS